MLATVLIGGCGATTTGSERMTSDNTATPKAYLELADGVKSVTTADLESIRQALRTALADSPKGSGPADYEPLAKELEGAGAFIAPDGTARIGRWTLQTRDGQAVLVRQQFPRAPVMFFHVARLTNEKGQWTVRDIAIEKVAGVR
jgi:hypothetical protein